MKPKDPCTEEFDEFSGEYNTTLRKSISISGEEEGFFDDCKIECIKRYEFPIDKKYRILDFGCGIGRFAKKLAEAYSSSSIHGYDVSFKSLEIAEKQSNLSNLHFCKTLQPEQEFDLIIVANVFHHIEPNDRPKVLNQLACLMKSNGKLVIFEHNPLNPVTRYVVANCPFDKGCHLLYTSEWPCLTSGSSLIIQNKRFIVFFPKILRYLRVFDRFLTKVPLGAQYMITILKSPSHAKPFHT